MEFLKTSHDLEAQKRKLKRSFFTSLGSLRIQKPKRVGDVSIFTLYIEPRLHGVHKFVDSLTFLCGLPE